MNTTRAYPRARTAATNTNAIGHAGGVLLTETVRATGLDVGTVGRAVTVPETTRQA